MIKFWIIGITLFTLITYLISKLSLNYYKKQQSEEMWKKFGVRTRYWQGVILASLLLTFLIMMTFKKMDVLTF
jgi:hypothetical protein